jgi:hypothetical protein
LMGRHKLSASLVQLALQFLDPRPICGLIGHGGMSESILEGTGGFGTLRWSRCWCRFCRHRC